MGRSISVSLSLLVVAFCLSGAKAYYCPYGWLPMNGLCYKIFEEQKNWIDSEMFCRKYKPGCHLASIHSRAESGDLAEYITDYLIKKDPVWIGLYDPWKNYAWEWTDRSRTNYLVWNKKQPDHYQNKEYCVEIVNYTEYRLWNDQDCAALRSFICQCRF